MFEREELVLAVMPQAFTVEVSACTEAQAVAEAAAPRVGSSRASDSFMFLPLTSLFALLSLASRGFCYGFVESQRSD